MSEIAVALAVLLEAGLAAAPAPSRACGLLSEAEVRAVQGHPVVQTLPSEQPNKSFRVAQCLYRTRDLAHSVSLALTMPSPGAPLGPRDYWGRRFRAAAEPEHGSTASTTARKPDPPRPVAGLGEEAFWVGDRVAGALYVLQGASFLRVSVGGAADERVRLTRSRSLAERALDRLAVPPKVAR